LSCSQDKKSPSVKKEFNNFPEEVMTSQNNTAVEIFDTTFRDGLQGQRSEISVRNALKIIKLMAILGFRYAELGFACANEFARQLIAAALKEDLGQMKIAAFGRTRKAGQRVEDSEDVRAMLELKVPVAVVVCKSRLMDVVQSLQTTAEENLAMVFDTVNFLHEQGLTVILDLEHAVDAYFGRGCFGAKLGEEAARQNLAHFHEVVRTGIKAGAHRLVICDTNGGASPEEIGTLFFELSQTYPGVVFGFHGHNDCDLATANTRAAVLNGAGHIQGTINGLGERVGNANLISLISRLQIKDGINLMGPEALTQLTNLSHITAQAFSVELNRQSPFVGHDATHTAAGMHASGLTRDNGSYLCFDPAAVGNKERVSVNKQSGKSNVLTLSKELGVPLDSTQAVSFMDANKAMIEGGGYEASEASFTLACRRALGSHRGYFDVISYQVQTGCRNEVPFANAQIKVQIGANQHHTIEDGSGPVDALSKALWKALNIDYPEITQIALKSFDLHALDVSSEGTGALVRVVAVFACGDEECETAGVSHDSNAAALKAIADGIEWFLSKTGNGSKHATA
jgi:2-isopropylmalate synthase